MKGMKWFGRRMKSYIVWGMVLLWGWSMASKGYGQCELVIPERSPRCTLIQNVGLSTITIDYSRPSMRSRVIFGKVVPYDQMWAIGANEATTIEFSDDVLVSGELLKAGKYALYAIPREDVWDIIFYSDWDQFGLPEPYRMDKEALRVEVEPEELAMTFETLLINLDYLRDSAATLQILWDDVLVEIPLIFDTKAKVVEGIQRIMSGPSRSDYYLAAKYYYENRVDDRQALDWVNKANQLGERYWQYYLKALILKRMGERNEALAAAQRAKELALQAGNMRYVHLSERVIEALGDVPDEEPTPSEDQSPQPKKMQRKEIDEPPRSSRIEKSTPRRVQKRVEFRTPR